MMNPTEPFVDLITSPPPLGRTVDSYKLLDVLTVHYTTSWFQEGADKDQIAEIALRDMELKMWHARLEYERSYNGIKSSLLFGATEWSEEPPGGNLLFCWYLRMPVYQKIRELVP